MILTEKDKFKKFYDIQPVLKCSNDDLFEKVMELYPDRKNGGAILTPFDNIDKIEVVQGLNIRYKDLLRFADSANDDEIIKATADVYLGITDIKKIMNLPMLKFIRLVQYGKDIALYANTLFSKMKRSYTAAEIEAGIDKIPTDHFNMIDAYCKRNGIVSRDDGYNEQWFVIYRCLQHDFDMDEFNRRYSEIITKKKK